MHKPSRNNQLYCQLMVNHTLFHSVQIRMLEPIDDFEVVVTDQLCGTFAIHDAFELNLLEGATWRPLTLFDLKKMLRESREFPRLLDVPGASEMAELRLFDRWFDDLDSPLRSSRPMDRITRYDRCVRRVKAVLQEGAIPCVPCGTVFVVPDRAQARRILLRAGFEPSRISSGALLEPFSGSAVYLLEREGTLNWGIRTK